MGMISIVASHLRLWSHRQYQCRGHCLRSYCDRPTGCRLGAGFCSLGPVRHDLLRKNVADDTELSERLTGLISFTKRFLPLMAERSQSRQWFFGAQRGLSAIHCHHSHSLKFLHRFANRVQVGMHEPEETQPEAEVESCDLDQSRRLEIRSTQAGLCITTELYQAAVQ